MKEQFDKRLVEKIRISFDEHEEAFDPKEWDKFSQSYFHRPAKRKKLVLWPFVTSGVAAALVLMFFLFPYEKEIEQSVTDIKGTIANKSQKIEELLKPSAKETATEAPEPIEQELMSTPKSEKEEVDLLAISEEEKVDRKIYEAVKSISVGVPSWKEGSEDFIAFGNEMAFQNGGIAKEDLATGSTGKTLEETSPQVIAQEEKQIANSDPEKAQAWVEQWKNGTEEKMTASNNASTIIKKEEKNGSAFRLGVLAGPQAASNSTSGMKLGAGVISEFAINDKLRVDVGVTYAHQNIEPTTPTKLPESMSMRAATSSDVNSAFAVTNNYIGSEYSLSYYGLDIPVNVKYKVLDKSKADLFLITGLSSMVYLNQTGTETFAVESKFSTDMTGALQFSESVQQFSQEYTPEGGDSSVDLGRMLNFSFGYEYNLNNGTFISIEPYYKLPLGDLTFTNQQFSIGGVNLRMNFQFKK